MKAGIELAVEGAQGSRRAGSRFAKNAVEIRTHRHIRAIADREGPLRKSQSATVSCSPVELTRLFGAEQASLLTSVAVSDLSGERHFSYKAQPIELSEFASGAGLRVVAEVFEDLGEGVLKCGLTSVGFRLLGERPYPSLHDDVHCAPVNRAASEASGVRHSRRGAERFRVD